MIWLEVILWQQNVLLGMGLQNQIMAINAASDLRCNRLFALRLYVGPGNWEADPAALNQQRGET